MRIALDVDGVLADFPTAIINAAHRLGFSHWPEFSHDVDRWIISDDFMDVFSQVCNKPEFWLDSKPLGHMPDFKPEMYLTARPIPQHVTERWLNLNDFPKAKVVTVADPAEKLKIMQFNGIDILIDDYYKTILQINASPCKTIGLLFKAPYQRGHEEEIKTCVVVENLSQRHIVDKAVQQLQYKNFEGK